VKQKILKKILASTPGGNSISACELTCAMISALARNMTKACQSMKEGRWDRKLYAGSELSGKVLGVLGFGRIGREVSRRMQSYGMRILAFDPLLDSEQAAELQVTKADLEVLWNAADYITVHTPLIPQTKSETDFITTKAHGLSQPRDYRALTPITPAHHFQI
jgi:D-3-phosphoglycerate dehydrogenase